MKTLALLLACFALATIASGCAGPMIERPHTVAAVSQPGNPSGSQKCITYNGQRLCETDTSVPALSQFSCAIPSRLMLVDGQPMCVYPPHTYWIAPVYGIGTGYQSFSFTYIRRR